MAKIPFSQTMRALQADHGRYSRLTLSLAVVVLLLWGYWLFTAATYHYISSKDIEITLGDQPVWKISKGEKRAVAYHRYAVRAYFNPSDFYQIKLGQKTRLMMTSLDTLPRRALTAKVDRIDPVNKTVDVQLELRAEAAKSLAGATVERMEIAVSHQTPAAFLFHTARPASP
ncbi:HlyD family secretion protein [Candidatus Electrothrix laxa]